MKGTYNNQNRKSGGYPKTKITVGKKVGGQSLPCDEKRHSDCDGYLTFFPHLKGYACQCDCHKKANVTTKVEPTETVSDKKKRVNRALFTSVKQDWKTPRAVYQTLDAEFGFDFDPCPTKPNFDGLSCEWGQVNYCNPPYNELAKWIAKGYEEWQKGKTVVFLIPSRTDTISWHKYCMKATEIRFIKGRLSFDDNGGRATFPSAIIIFRSNL